MILILSGIAFAQALGLGVADHSVAPPFGNVAPTWPVRPAAVLEVEAHGLAGRHLALVPGARLTAHHHPAAGSGWRVSPALTGRATSGLGPYAELGIEAGVNHTFFGRSLVRDGTSYRQTADPGRLGVHAGTLLGAGVDLGRRTDLPVAVGLVYRWFVQSAWLPAVGVGPMSELGLAARWSWGGAP